MAKILCIEDEADYREGLVDFLSHSGFEVDEAVDGEEGIRKAICGDHDLVLCDIKMPKKSGYDVLKEMQDRAGNELQKPFIFLSAYGQKDNIMSALDRGASYLVKPVDFDLLLTKINARLNTFNQVERIATRQGRRGRSSAINLLKSDISAPLQMINRFSEIIVSQELGEINEKKYIGYARMINESSHMVGRMINELSEATLESCLHASGETTTDLETILWKVKSRLENIHDMPYKSAKLSITGGDTIIAANPHLVARMMSSVASSISRQMEKPQEVLISAVVSKDKTVCFSITGVDFEELGSKKVSLKELTANQSISGSMIIPLEFAEEVSEVVGGNIDFHMDSLGNIKATFSLPALDRE